MVGVAWAKLRSLAGPGGVSQGWKAAEPGRCAGPRDQNGPSRPGASCIFFCDGGELRDARYSLTLSEPSCLNITEARRS